MINALLLLTWWEPSSMAGMSSVVGYGSTGTDKVDS